MKAALGATLRSVERSSGNVLLAIGLAIVGLDVAVAFFVRQMRVVETFELAFIAIATFLTLLYAAIVMIWKLRIMERIYISRIARTAAELAHDLSANALTKSLSKTAIRYASFDLSRSLISTYIARTYDSTHATLPLIVHPPLNEVAFPLLSSNFGVYAHCIKNVLATVRTLIETGRIGRATIYTFFERTIFEWYNPLTSISGARDGRRQLISYSQQWWEDYKADLANFKASSSSDKPPYPILIIRLIAHPKRPAIAADGSADVEVADAGSFRDRYIIEGVTREPSLVHHHCQAIPGFEPISLIRDAAELDTSPVGRACVHCILERKNDQPAPTEWHPMLEHFEMTYHNGPYSPERTFGCFYKYATKEIFPWAGFADAFVVELQGGSLTPPEGDYFGVALQKDGFNDAEGIKILTSSESEAFKTIFSKVVLHESTSSTFCTVAPGSVWVP